MMSIRNSRGCIERPARLACLDGLASQHDRSTGAENVEPACGCSWTAKDSELAPRVGDACMRGGASDEHGYRLGLAVEPSRQDRHEVQSRRVQTLQLFEPGLSMSAIARCVGCSRKTALLVVRWAHHHWRDDERVHAAEGVDASSAPEVSDDIA
jgi:hypothetical protein